MGRALLAVGFSGDEIFPDADGGHLAGRQENRKALRKSGLYGRAAHTLYE